MSVTPAPTGLSSARTSDLGRTEYDLEAAIERLRAADWPELDDFRKHSFLERLEPDSVSEPFERRAQGTEQSPPP
jgi:hypothetical protein